jgi:galactitol-specific phosphotransferase system IIB component
MLQDSVEKVIEFATGPYCPDEINDGKAEYSEILGNIFSDDESFDSRMASFLEWYILDRNLKATGTSPISVYIKHNFKDWSEETQAYFSCFKKNVHGLFLVKKPMRGSVIAINLFDKIKYKVEETQSELVFRKNDIFEGRAIPFQDGYRFTGTYCFHPQQTSKFIKNQIEKIVKEKEILETQIKNLNTELNKLDSKITKLTVKSERLSNKIESSNSESKKTKLENERKITESEKLDLEIRRPPLRDELDHIETQKLGIEIPIAQKKLMHQLSFMNLRWERSRQIDLKDIYK